MMELSPSEVAKSVEIRKKEESEARTFVHTPWGFHLELQRRRDVVDEEQKAVITKIQMRMPFSPDPRVLAEWLGAEGMEEAGGITLMCDGWRLQLTGGEPVPSGRRFPDHAGFTL